MGVKPRRNEQHLRGIVAGVFKVPLATLARALLGVNALIIGPPSVTSAASWQKSACPSRTDWAIRLG